MLRKVRSGIISFENKQCLSKIGFNPRWRKSARTPWSSQARSKGYNSTLRLASFRLMKWNVSSPENGYKLIDFLKSKLGPKFSNRQLKRWIEANHCQVNGRVERFASTHLAVGNQIELDVEFNEDKTQTLVIEKSQILYEDKALFILNKPSGVASDDPVLIKTLSVFTSNLELVHRLDKETSGILIFAKSKEIYQKMISLFREKKIRKTYLAIVDGIPKQRSGIVDNYLGKLHQYAGQALWGAVNSGKGVHARTEWLFKKAGKETALLICHPITGRTHQIRVHLSESGHPILGDYQYGRTFRSALRPKRCMLHAYQISFSHPLTDQIVKAEAPIPVDFQETLDRIFL
jgi:RluA family pseudouridine synthase